MTNPANMVVGETPKEILPTFIIDIPQTWWLKKNNHSEGPSRVHLRAASHPVSRLSVTTFCLGDHGSVIEPIP